MNQTTTNRIRSLDPVELSKTMAIWINTSKRMLGMEAEAVAVPEKRDTRFEDEEWQKNPLFDFVKQSVLFAGRSKDTIGDLLCGGRRLPNRQEEIVKHFRSVGRERL